MPVSVKEKLFNHNHKDRLVIALDGPSASGKGHIGRLLAGKFGLEYVESSRVYRGLAYLCLQRSIKEADLHEIIELSKENVLNLCRNVDLQHEEIGQMASKVSIIPEVRKNLTKGLVSTIASTHRIIMEGRDIASVVAPEADIKIFITADVNIRAERRYKQLRAAGKECMLADILDALVERDQRDSNRKVAPLKAMPDSIVVDTSELSPEEVVEYIIDSID